jgi:hypothetical protein
MRVRAHLVASAGRHHRVARINPNRNKKKCSKSAPFCYETAKKLGKPVVNLELFLEIKLSSSSSIFHDVGVGASVWSIAGDPPRPSRWGPHSRCALGCHIGLFLAEACA